MTNTNDTNAFAAAKRDLIDKESPDGPFARCDFLVDLLKHWSAIRRALEMASDPAFVRVPVVPTEVMIEAVTPAKSDFIGHPNAPEESKERWCRGYRDAAIERYKTMIAASQTPPNEERQTNGQ